MSAPADLPDTSEPGLPKRAFGRLVRALSTLKDQQVAVLIARTLPEQRSSYRELGDRFGVSAEAVRRQVARVSREVDEALDQLDEVADLVAATCGRPIARHQVVSFIEATGIPIPQHEQGADPFGTAEAAIEIRANTTDLAALIFWHRLEARFVRGLNGAWLTQGTAVRCAEIEDLADALSDEYGLIREATLVDWLPAHLAADWIGLQELCAIRRLGSWVVTGSGLASTSAAPGGYPIRRTTAVALALREVGHPATYEEIRAQLDRYGLDRDFRLDAVVSRMSDVVRASRSRWGFRRWVDEVYGGISAAIEQRIADGGGRANLNALVKELSTRFGVSASSVGTYAHTDRYEVVGGFVQMADVSQLQFAPLDEVVDGYLTEGTPYWCFRVEERFFRGYSLPTVPPAVASFLGCGPDSSLVARVRRPAGVEPVSVIWRTNAVHGPEIGRIADTLERLGAAEGDEVAVLLHGQSQVSLVLRRDLTPPPTEEEPD